MFIWDLNLNEGNIPQNQDVHKFLLKKNYFLEVLFNNVIGKL